MDRFELEWYGPDGCSYVVSGYITGPGAYDEASWSIEQVQVEGPDGPLDWGDCTDLDAPDWPSWAHRALVEEIDSIIEARRYGL
jgi:hypothetical protein